MRTSTAPANCQPRVSRGPCAALQSRRSRGTGSTPHSGQGGHLGSAVLRVTLGGLEEGDGGGRVGWSAGEQSKGFADGGVKTSTLGGEFGGFEPEVDEDGDCGAQDPGVVGFGDVVDGAYLVVAEGQAG